LVKLGIDKDLVLCAEVDLQLRPTPRSVADTVERGQQIRSDGFAIEPRKSSRRRPRWGDGFRLHIDDYSS
jgi:hypothetical protein